MPFDGSVLHAVVCELSENLRDGRISKIYQPERFSVILEVHSQKGLHRLLISCNPEMPRVHITREIYHNPPTPPAFCMLLRKHLSGGRIVDFGQPEFERILKIDIEAMDEIGNLRIKTLCIEIMGKHSNIVLIEPETQAVYDSLRRVTSDISGYRELVPGANYLAPPNPGKLNPLEAAGKLFDMAVSNPFTALVDVMVDSFNGISPLLAKSLLKESGITANTCAAGISAKQVTELSKKFEHYFEKLKLKKFEPVAYFKTDGTPKDFYIMPLAVYAELPSKTYATINETLDSFYKQKTEQAALDRLRQFLKKSVMTRLNRAFNKKKLQELQLSQAIDFKRYRIYGELIAAYMYKINPGHESVIVDNFYEDPPKPVEIPLDTRLSPAMNAQRYFKKYNKLKSTLNHLQVYLQKTVEEIEYLEGVLYSIENSSDTSGLLEIHGELEESGYLDAKKTAASKQAVVLSEPYKYISSDGYTVWVGKNNRTNDLLTLKKAKPDDYWLHTKDIPGAHVVVVSGGKQVPASTLREAAVLAAYHSKAKNSGNVPVDYTLRKHVSKPKGARPGMVVYKNHRTLFVTPDAQTVERLKV